MNARNRGIGAVADAARQRRRDGAGVAIRGLEHSYGELRTIERLDLEAGRTASSAWSGPRAAASRPCWS